MSYRGYKGVNDPTNMVVGCLEVMLLLLFLPPIFGAIGGFAGYWITPQDQTGIVIGALIGAAIALIFVISRAITMPERVRKARALRDAHNRFYRNL